MMLNVVQSPVSETYCTGSFLGAGSNLLVFCFSLGDFFDFFATFSSSESADRKTTYKRCREDEERHGKLSIIVDLM